MVEVGIGVDPVQEGGGISGNILCYILTVFSSCICASSNAGVDPRNPIGPARFQHSGNGNISNSNLLWNTV